MHLNKFYLLAHRSVTQGARRLWQGLPLSTRDKEKLRHRLFSNFPFIFRRFKSYADWQRHNAPIDNSLHDVSYSASRSDPSQRIVVVSHNAQAHGAQFLALGMVRMLKQELGLDVEVILLGGGRLKSDFAALALVHELSEFDAKISDMGKLARSLVQRGFTRAIVNTTTSGKIVPVFSDAGIECICLVHELPGVIQSHQLEQQARQIAASAKTIVFPAQIVADGFSQFAHVDSARQVIRPQGLYRKNKWRTEKDAARAALRQRLGLPSAAKVVLAVGYADYRKGVDLFVECAFEILEKRDDVDFVWVGHWDAKMQSDIEKRLLDRPCKDHIHFVGYDPDTSIYHAGSDVYALTSREDPFPNVVLESLDAGVPVVAFSSTGGAANLVVEVGGLTVPAQNVAAFSAAICRLLDTPGLSASLGKAAQDHVDRHFSFRTYLLALCELLGIDPDRNK
ncbi:MAG: glycosyltransferase family 4 protein [Gallionella sp.]